MIDCLDNNTFSEEKNVQTLSNWDLKIIKAANVPDNYMEEGHMREHCRNLSKYLTTLQQEVIKELEAEPDYHQHEKNHHNVKQQLLQLLFKIPELHPVPHRTIEVR